MRIVVYLADVVIMIRQSFLTKSGQILRRVNTIDRTIDMEAKLENIMDHTEVATLAAAIMVVMVITEVRPPPQPHNSLLMWDRPEPEVSIPCNILSANIPIRQCSLTQICDHLTVSFFFFRCRFWFLLRTSSQIFFRLDFYWVP